MSLPVPTDPAFTVPDDEDAFLHPQGQEDDALLATGAWDDVDVEPPAAARPKVRVHVHRDN